MDPAALSSVIHLSDEALVARVKHLAAREREARCALIPHLADLDERRKYLAEGCASLFTYCCLTCIPRWDCVRRGAVNHRRNSVRTE